MADIDDMLLALAGGGESSTEAGTPDDQASEASASRIPDGSDAGHGDGQATSKNPSKSGREDDGENEREVSPAPSSPNSLDSAPMDESESEDEMAPRTTGGANDGDNKYPVEGIYKSLAEKGKIERMAELQREQLLADRAAEVEKQSQKRILRQLVSKQENEEKEKQLQLQLRKKRPADLADLEDGQRKTSRQRTRLDGNKVGEASSAIDSLRRAKAEKNDRQRRREEDRERKTVRGSPRSGASSGSPSASSPPAGPGVSPAPASPPGVKQLPPPELRDAERLRVGRHRFGEVCYTPGFDKGLVGCYVRVSIGPSPENQVDQYRMAVIKGFGTGRGYAMEGPGGMIVTDQYVKVAHGRSVKEIPFIACSDRAFTEAEWNRYKIACINDGLVVPTKEQMIRKLADVNTLVSHIWTSDEIEAKVKRKNELRRQFDPAERERLTRQLDEATERGSVARAAQLQAELDKVITLKLAFRTSLGPPRNSGDSPGKSQQDRLAEVNRERRRHNAESVRRAQIKEQAKSRKIEAALARGEHVEEDMSRRVKTRAKLVHDPEGLNRSPPRTAAAAAPNSGNSTPAAGTPKTEPAKPTLPAHPVRLQQASHTNGIPTIHRPLMDDDIIGALDLELDVDMS